MISWWQRDVIAAGKLPLMLCFLSFVVTFASTRTITRLIRDGRGPFRNVSVGGTHVHHSVPGVILLMIGAFTAVGGPGTLGWRSFSAVAVGIGTSLVLDEFALIRSENSTLPTPLTCSGLNPTRASPRQAATRLTASTESWPSPLQ